VKHRAPAASTRMAGREELRRRLQLVAIFGASLIARQDVKAQGEG